MSTSSEWQKIQTCCWLLFVGADGIFKRLLKEKTTDIKRVVVMGIIIKGADGLGGYRRLAGYF